MQTPQLRSPKRLGPEHAPDLADLEARCFPDAWDTAGFAAAFDRRAFAAFGVVQEDNGLAAYVTLHVLGDEFEIINIATAPSLRGQGVASRLLAHVLQHTDKMGMNRGYLEVRAGNTPAKQLYLRHGFSVAGVRKRYYPDNGEDALVMVRNHDPAASRIGQPNL